MKPGETNNNKQTVYFPIFDSDGLPASGEVGEGTVATVTVATQLQVNRDGAGWSNAAGTFTHVSDGLYSYLFTDSEVSGSTEGTILLRYKRTGWRTQIIPVPLELVAVDSLAANSITASAIADNAIDAGAIAADAITAAKIATGAITAAKFAAGAIDAAAIATDAIDADALAGDAVTEIQAGLATAAALTTVAGYIDTEVAAIKAKTDNLPADPASQAAVIAAIPSANAVRDAVLDALLQDHATIGSVADGIAIAAGLLQGNFMMDNVDNTNANGQTAARMRLWRSAAAMAGATMGGVGAQGAFAIFAVTTTYEGPNKITMHKVERTA